MEKILFNEEAKEITKNGLWNVITKNNKFISPILINAAGAWCDEVSILAGCNHLIYLQKEEPWLFLKIHQI